MEQLLPLPTEQKFTIGPAIPIQVSAEFMNLSQAVPLSIQLQRLGLQYNVSPTGTDYAFELPGDISLLKQMEKTLAFCSELRCWKMAHTELTTTYEAVNLIGNKRTATERANSVGISFAGDSATFPVTNSRICLYYSDKQIRQEVVDILPGAYIDTTDVVVPVDIYNMATVIDIEINGLWIPRPKSGNIFFEYAEGNYYISREFTLWSGDLPPQKLLIIPHSN